MSTACLVPTVTVVIPTYNRAVFVSEAIDSVLAQTVPVTEIIVVDDGSVDDTAATLASYGSKVRCIVQSNQGASAARNHGIKVATGTFIALLDSDDLWAPNKIEEQLRYFEENPAVDFICTGMTYFTASGPADSKERRDPPGPESTPEIVVLDHFFERLVRGNDITTSSVIGSRSAFSTIGDFDVTLTPAEDLDYWLRSSVIFKWALISSSLVKRRRHPGNLVANWIKLNVALHDVLTRTGTRLAASADARAVVDGKLFGLNYDLGSAYLKKLNFSSAFHYLGMRVPGHKIGAKWRLKLVIAWILKRKGNG